MSVLEMKLWKVNNALLSSCEQWTLTQLRCLPGSSFLTHMTAILKKYIQELGIWVLQLSEHRVATGATPNHEIHQGGRRQMRVQMLPAKQGVKGKHKIPVNCQHTGTDVFWLHLHGDIETAVKLVILMYGVFAFDVGKSAFVRESQKNKRDGGVKIINK